MLFRSGRTVFSLRATSVSAYSSSPSHGRRSALMFEGALLHCESTTGRHTRSGCRPTACWDPNCRTWTALGRAARAPSPCSTDRHRTFWFSIARKAKSRRSVNGLQPGPKKGSRLAKWVSSFVPPLNWTGHVRRLGMPDSPRSEEHTSELQSRQYLVCRLL